MSGDDFQSRSSEVGRAYEEHVAQWIATQTAWDVVARKYRHPSGIEADVFAHDPSTGGDVAVECKGGNLPSTAGLLRSDNRWKVLGQALALDLWNRAHPTERVRFVVVSSAQPLDDADGGQILRLAELAGLLTVVVLPAIFDTDDELER